MTPLARISAAIDHLTEFSADASDGPWELGGPWGIHSRSGGLVADLANDVDGALIVAMTHPLVVGAVLSTLHQAKHELEQGRTIDLCTVTLADAILGGES